MRSTTAGEYRAVLAAAAQAATLPAGERRRIVGRLRRELHRIAARDHFPPPEREQAHAAVADLATRTAEAAR